MHLYLLYIRTLITFLSDDIYQSGHFNIHTPEFSILSRFRIVLLLWCHFAIQTPDFFFPFQGNYVLFYLIYNK